VGWGKVACWTGAKKAAIFLKRVKIDEKLLWRAYRKSPSLLRTVVSPTTHGLPFPKIGVCNPNPKLQLLLARERVKLRTANFAIHSQGPSEQKPMKNLGEKGPWAYPGSAPIFWVPPIISGMGKTTNYKFCRHIHRIYRNKSPLKIWAKVAVGVLTNSRKFSGHPYIGRSARSSLP